MESRSFRNLMGLWPTGVAVIAGCTDAGEPLGFVVGSLCSVSLSPMLVAFCVQKQSSTWEQLRARGRCAINMLSLAQAELCWRFASGDPARRFDGVPFDRGGADLPHLRDCCGWLDVEVRSEVDAGDHWLVIAEVTAMQAGAIADPLTFAKGRLNRVEPWLELDPDHLAPWEQSLNALYCG